MDHFQTGAIIGSDGDLIAALVDAGVVDVSSLSRLLSSKRIVVVEDKDLTVLKAVDRALGRRLFSSASSSYVLPAKGVGNFRAVKELGEVLSKLAGSKFDIVFVQDRDGMPDFMSSPLAESQKGAGVTSTLLERHEIESYLLEPKLISAAAKRGGWALTPQAAEDAILRGAAELSAEARQMSRKTAIEVNRHLKLRKDDELEVEADKWFNTLDMDSLSTVRRVFPGKELLKNTLKRLNANGQHQLTLGSLVAALDANHVADDLKDLFEVLTKP